MKKCECNIKFCDDSVSKVECIDHADGKIMKLDDQESFVLEKISKCAEYRAKAILEGVEYVDHKNIITNNYE
jgi:hypothetical protein